MENPLFTHLQSDLPGPLSFDTAMENKTIFLQQFFSVSLGSGSFPNRSNSNNQKQWRTQEGVSGVQPPSEPEKIVVEKWCYFLKLYFYQQLYQK